MESRRRLITFLNYNKKEGLKFLKIEWSGDWGDNSSKWNSYPDVKRDLNFENKDDGTFWYEF